MALFTEDFTGTDTDPWNTTNWETATGAGTRTINSNKGRIVTTGGTDYDGVTSQLKSGLGVVGDFDATIDVGWTSLAGTAAAQFIWNFRHNFFGEGFRIHVRQSGGVWYWDLYSETGYASTSRANGTTTPPANSGDTWRFRVQCIGSAVKGKWWDLAGGEPGSWQAEITESNAASETGMRFDIGQHENTTSMTFDVDNLVVSAPAAAAIRRPAAAPVWRRSLSLT